MTHRAPSFFRVALIARGLVLAIRWVVGSGRWVGGLWVGGADERARMGAIVPMSLPWLCCDHAVAVPWLA